MKEKKKHIDLKAKTKSKLQNTNITTNIECDLNNRVYYQAETNEQNSGEN